MSPDICEANVSPKDSTVFMDRYMDGRMWIWMLEYGCYTKLEDIQGTEYINNGKKRQINKPKQIKGSKRPFHFGMLIDLIDQ